METEIAKQKPYAISNSDFRFIWTVRKMFDHMASKLYNEKPLFFFAINSHFTDIDCYKSLQRPAMDNKAT